MPPSYWTALFHPVSFSRFPSCQRTFGRLLLGVLINDIPDQASFVATHDQTFLEAPGYSYHGNVLLSNRLPWSVSVRELVRQLQAEVLCRSDRLDLMVEN